jgi:hypothetical protein
MHGEESALDQVRLRRPPHAQRHVSLAHGKVQLVVGQDHRDADVRIGVEEFRDALGQPEGAEPDRGRHPELAARPLARLL